MNSVNFNLVSAFIIRLISVRTNGNLVACLLQRTTVSKHDDRQPPAPGDYKRLPGLTS